MKKIRIYAAAFTLASAALINPSHASAKTDNSRVHPVDGNVQFSPTRWRFVKQIFQLRIPQNHNPISQIIIEVPSTVAVSNDIVVRDKKGQEIKTDVSVNGRKLIIDFSQKNISNTRLIIEFNKVKQAIFGSASVYSFSAKVVGSDVEIPIGEVRFSPF